MNLCFNSQGFGKPTVTNWVTWGHGCTLDCKAGEKGTREGSFHWSTALYFFWQISAPWCTQFLPVHTPFETKFLPFHTRNNSTWESENGPTTTTTTTTTTLFSPWSVGCAADKKEEELCRGGGDTEWVGETDKDGEKNKIWGETIWRRRKNSITPLGSAAPGRSGERKILNLFFFWRHLE